jgi:hypothetical protein
MGIRKDRARYGLEFVLALEALVHEPIRAGSLLAFGVGPGLSLFRELGNPLAVAAQASNAVRPPGSLEVVMAGLFVREKLRYRYQAGPGSIAAHESIVRQLLIAVKYRITA